jgi:Predicted ATPase
MKITSLRIKNLYSFEDENIVFNDFNLIVGPNGGGKTNIIRSLKTIINRPYSVRNEETENNKTTSYSTLPIGPQAKLENLLYSSISPDIKLSRENKSAIKLECQISKEELRLLFEFIFKKDIEIEEIKDYDDAVFTLLITWPVEFSSNINPDFLIFRFPNGFTFLHSNSYNNYFTYIDEQNVLDDF